MTELAARFLPQTNCTIHDLRERMLTALELWPRSRTIRCHIFWEGQDAGH
jgi:hypothetical protein